MTLWTIGAVGVWVAGLLVAPPGLPAQRQQISWSEQEKPIVQALHGLRSLPDDARARETKQLALDIRALPAGDHKLGLANGLANLSTEGDFGRDTLQEVATTLAAALAEHPAPEERGEPAMPYLELAQLVRYEHVQASVDSPQFGKAMSELEADDQERQQADFTLTDLEGKPWSLKSLARESGVGEFLGYLVPALPQGNARSRVAVQAVSKAGTGDPRHLRRRCEQG